MSHVLDITIDHTKVAADLDDFPVLIVPVDDANWAALYAIATEGGGDLRFFKAGGSVELPREIVSFSVSAKTGEIHVKFSGTLSSSVDTVIEVHADGSSSDYAVTATYGRNAVWSNYALVLHMTGSTATEITDSTANGNDVTSGSANGYNVAGKIGQAVDMAQDNSELRIDDDASLDIASGDITMQAWTNTDILNSGSDSKGFRTVLSKGTYAVVNYGMVWDWSGGAAQILTGVVDNAAVRLDEMLTAGEEVAIGEWHPVVITYDGTTMLHYLDGAQIGSKADAEAAYTTNSSYLYIGSDGDTNREFDGQIDELRISAQLLSADWVATEFNNQDAPSTFYSVASVATGPEYTLTAEAGTFALTGQDTGLFFNRILAAEAGTFAMTGSAAELLRSVLLTAGTGTFVVSGNDADLLRTLRIAAETASFDITASDASLLVSRLLSASVASYVLSGAEVGLSVSRILSTEPGEFTMTGNSAGLFREFVLPAETAEFLMDGQDAGLTLQGLLQAEAGSFMLTGNDVAFERYFGFRPIFRPRGPKFTDRDLFTPQGPKFTDRV